jgi:hypothetical protein
MPPPMARGEALMQHCGVGLQIEQQISQPTRALYMWCGKYVSRWWCSMTFQGVLAGLAKVSIPLLMLPKRQYQRSSNPPLSSLPSFLYQHSFCSSVWATRYFVRHIWRGQCAQKEYSRMCVCVCARALSSEDCKVIKSHSLDLQLEQ